jgi:ankyrin repeat protein
MAADAGMQLGLLFRAVSAGDAPKLQALLASRAAGVDLNVRCPEGRTMLHLAAERGGAALVPLLVGAGAAVDAPSGGAAPMRQTPLLLAAVHSPAAALALLSCGARAGLCDSDGGAPLAANAARLHAAAGPERALREQLAAALAARLAEEAAEAQVGAAAASG